MAEQDTPSPAARPSAPARGSRPDRWRGVLYWSCVCVLRSIFTLLYRARVYGADRVPAAGPLLIVANHQSHLDPPFIGCFLHRRLFFVARSGLFKQRAFAWLITALGSLPIKEDGGDLSAIRQTIAYLKEGRAVLLFPEGSRTPDGAVKEFKRGAWLLLSKADCPVVPAAIEGAFDTWPRRRALPALLGRRVSVVYGEPIAPEDLRAMGAEQCLRSLRERIDAARAALRARLDR